MLRRGDVTYPNEIPYIVSESDLLQYTFNFLDIKSFVIINHFLVLGDNEYRSLEIIFAFCYAHCNTKLISFIPHQLLQDKQMHLHVSIIICSVYICTNRDVNMNVLCIKT